MINKYILFKFINMKFKSIKRCSKRISGIKALPSLATRSSTRLNFQKIKDTSNELNRIKKKANELLEKYNKVRISLVIPDNYYVQENAKYPHQGHTFALSRYKNILRVYDICQVDYEKIFSDAWDNYREIIYYLAKNRKIVYTPIVPKLYKLCQEHEGSCQKYINLLEENELIK